jgi:hypothetical protein
MNAFGCWTFAAFTTMRAPLPAPSGKFNLSLRLYWPSEDVVRGRRKPPRVASQELASSTRRN